MAGFRSTHPRTTTALLLALLSCVVAPSASGSDTISFSPTRYDGGPVLAADGRVVIAERLPGGARRILAIDPRTRAVNELARFPAAKPRTFLELKLAGSGAVVTATLNTLGDVSGSESEHASPPLLSSRAFTVLPALAPLATCDPVRPDFPRPILAAGGDGFVALAGDDCSLAAAVHLRVPGGTHTIPAEVPGSFLSPTDIADIRAAGPFATWTEQRLDITGPKATFTAVRATTGEVLLRAPTSRRYGLGSDGTIVLGDFGACALRVVSLAPPAQRDVPLAAGLCPGFFGNIVVAGGRAVYPVGGGYAVSDLHGAAHLVPDLPVDSVGFGSVAFDGRTLFGVRRRCHDEQLLAVDTTLTASAPLPLAPPPSLETCPVRRAGPGRLRVQQDARVGVRLRCPSGCRGTLRLVQQRRGRRERVIGSVDVVRPDGAPFTPRLRIARWARALAGCSGGLRAVAQIHRSDDRTKGLGTYRIVSRSSCRRTGGPAFTVPRSWPSER